jgi:hypothetical protein
MRLKFLSVRMTQPYSSLGGSNTLEYRLDQKPVLVLLLEDLLSGDVLPLEVDPAITDLQEGATSI